eukprot:CAMPEP_0119560414 /NCGR_PEP_ID=MMETSP1352-20130426/14821_1 /TAXON_ID=265584 /ORGANISM="Stauroneis constricta, Strain CCMP1120" /LENGTH=742 /DNA_ID=CAMNT_0007608385 /DNA_START=343 /DNA_END=2571 /DNA_ORIENTATION=-
MATATSTATTPQRMDRARKAHAERKYAKDASVHRKQLIDSVMDEYLDDDALADFGGDAAPGLEDISTNSSSVSAPSPSSLHSATSNANNTSVAPTSTKKKKKASGGTSKHKRSSSSNRPSKSAAAAANANASVRSARTSVRSKAMAGTGRDASHPEDTDGTLDRLLSKLNDHQETKSQRRSRSVHGNPYATASGVSATDGVSVSSSRRGTRTANGSASVVSDVGQGIMKKKKGRSRSTGPLDASTSAAAAARSDQSRRRSRRTAQGIDRASGHSDAASHISAVQTVATAPTTIGRDATTSILPPSSSTHTDSSSSKKPKSSKKNRSSRKSTSSTSNSPKTSSKSRKSAMRSSMRQSRSIDAPPPPPTPPHYVSSPVSSRRPKSAMRSTSVDAATKANYVMQSPTRSQASSRMSSNSARPSRTIGTAVNMAGQTENVRRRPTSRRNATAASQQKRSKSLIVNQTTSQGDLEISPPQSSRRRPQHQQQQQQASSKRSVNQEQSLYLDELLDFQTEQKQQSSVMDYEQQLKELQQSAGENSASPRRTRKSVTMSPAAAAAHRSKSHSHVRQGRSVERSGPPTDSNRHNNDSNKSKQRAQSCTPQIQFKTHSDASIRKIDYNVLKENFLSAGHFANNVVLVNTERSKHGLSLLQRNVQLDAMACDIAQRMAMAPRTAIPIQHLGNMKRGPTIRVIHASMMNNEMERENILNPDVTEFGMGTAKGGDGLLYLCQLFAKTQILVCGDM